MEITTKCKTHNCEKPAKAKGFCWTHYKRMQRHGSPDVNLRPKDWGTREDHPLYQIWLSLRRNHRGSVEESWRRDFWIMVKDVGEKPETDLRIVFKKEDPDQGIGPKNWCWREVKPLHSEDIKKQMRELARADRKANPDYYRDKDLQRTYGITLEHYNQMLKDQEGKCAICRNPETQEIKGRVLRLAVDHHHGKGHVRGLLCAKCNRGLGFFRDNPELMIKAAEYVNSYSFDN